MARRVLYVTYPVTPTDAEIAEQPATELVRRGLSEYEADEVRLISLREAVRGAALANVRDGQRWLAWSRRSFPETTFIASCVVDLLSGDDGLDPAQREARLVDACAVVERCDGIVLMGPRISSGMMRKRDHGIANHRESIEYGDRMFEVYDLTGLIADKDSGGWAARWAPSDRGPDTCPVSFEEWGKTFLV